MVPLNCLGMDVKGPLSLLKDVPHSTHLVQRRTLFVPHPHYHREFRLSSERHNIMRFINLHAILIALVVSAQAAASFIPTEERATAAESGSEEGFLPDVTLV